MNQFFRNWFNLNEKLRYLLVGFFNTLTSTLLYILAYNFFQNFIHYLVLAIVVHLISVLQSFILFKNLVFQSKGDFWFKYIKTNISYLAILGLNLLLLYLQVEIANNDPRIAICINTVIIAFFGYLLNKYFSFAD